MYWIDKEINKLKINKEVIKILLNYQQTDKWMKEAGGVLVGRYLKQGNDVVIDFATEPTKYDYRKRYFFHRTSKIHNEFVERKWKNSFGAMNYLGEWHTHPEKVPKPSFFDLKSWNEHLGKLDPELEFIFFIIVGTQSIGVWKGYLETRKIIEMEVLTK